MADGMADGMAVWGGVVGGEGKERSWVELIWNLEVGSGVMTLSW